MVKHLKRAALAAIAVVAAMAVVGPSTASATTLCATAPESHICPAPLLAETVLEFSLKKDKISSVWADNGLKISCKSSSGRLKTSSWGGKAADVLGQLEAPLSMTDCSNSLGQSCSVTMNNLPYSTTISWTAATHDGNLTIGSAGWGTPQTTSVCGTTKTTCIYGSNTVLLDIVGGSFAEVLATAEPLAKIEGPAACGETADWSAEYSIKKPEALYVESE